MDKRLKTRWIKALRSGKYKQGTGYLRLQDGKETVHCCLGVLCDLMKVPPVPGDVGFNFTTDDEDGDIYEEGCLPLRSAPANALVTPERKLSDDMGSLIAMNDGDPITGIKRRGFRGIALWIERNL